MIFLEHHPINALATGSTASAQGINSWVIIGLFILFLIGIIYWASKNKK